jgi:NitT/TauT family transport system substrate-binding protein
MTAILKHIRFVVLLLAVAPISMINAQVEVRAGFFPNISHPQALVGKAQGTFERSLGPGFRVEWKQFNAGPSVIEAIFAGALDLAYIGPSPTLNGYIQSHGDALRVVGGACSGGASLVVREGAGIAKASDFHGKRVASPQLGNTQDVALRAWLHSQGLATTDKGGDVQVLPLANPDQLTLFLKGELDAAWAPEPWATRLIDEGHGRLFLDERTLWPNGQFVSAHLIVRTEFLRQHPEVVRQWLSTHVDLTDWINAHPVDAKRILNGEIQKDTGKALPAAELDEAFARLTPTWDPLRSTLTASAQASVQAGALHRLPDLSGLYDLTLLNQVLTEKKKKVIP